MANFDGRKSARQSRKCAEIGRILVKEEIKARVKQISGILKKEEESRTEEEKLILRQSPEIVKSIDKRVKHRDTAKQRLLEIEDEPECLAEKCHQLAAAIRECKKVVVYTGAGISTAASIPDYRGPNGVWTLLQQGKELKAQDLSDAEPTATHMAIAKLHYENMVSHVVSQNCDGLHLRSGLPREVLSEVHGNMYIEICKECKMSNEYIRLFDVTEKTGVRRHRTERECHQCGSELRDTIVHFGEKGGLLSPYNWQKAADAADDADLILCLGSSLKILRKYPCLWHMDMRPRDRPQLFIVNLQWTPKDDLATLKINGKCDEVMHRVMAELGLEIPEYQREKDPIFKLTTKLDDAETEKISKKMLQVPHSLEPSQFSYKKKTVRKKKPARKKNLAPSQKYRTIKALLEGQVENIRKREDVESDQSSQDSKDSASTNTSLSMSEPQYKTIRQMLNARTLYVGSKCCGTASVHRQGSVDVPVSSDVTVIVRSSGVQSGESSQTNSVKCSNSDHCTLHVATKCSTNYGAKQIWNNLGSGDVKVSQGLIKTDENAKCLSEQNPANNLAEFTMKKFPCLSSSSYQPKLELGEAKSSAASYDLCELDTRQDRRPETEDESSPTVTEVPPIFDSGSATSSGKPTLTSIPGWFGKGLNPRKRKRKM